jgi:hypothetical protein
MDIARRKFRQQQRDAAHRGINFLLSFGQWWSIWQRSGHWDQRGIRRGQYVMARYGDQGPYAVGNVRICTTTENSKERRWTAATRAKLSDRNRSRWQNPEYRARMAAMWAARALSVEAVV